MSEKEIGTYMKEIKHTMECEGFSITEREEEVSRQILRGNITANEAVKKVLNDLKS